MTVDSASGFFHRHEQIPLRIDSYLHVVMLSWPEQARFFESTASRE